MWLFGSLQPCAAATLQPPSDQRFQHQHRRRRLSTVPVVRCVVLTKRGERFLTKLCIAHPSAAKHLIRKFVKGSSSAVALTTLSHLLSPRTTHPHLTSFAIPLYTAISRASWFHWSPKVVGRLVAFLAKHGQYQESEKLVNEAVAKIEFGERDRERLVLFYCNILDSLSKQVSEGGLDTAYPYLKSILNDSPSLDLKLQRRAYKCMVNGLCTMGRPSEAEDLLEEVRAKGLAVSSSYYRCLLSGYGRLGKFQDMLRVVNQMEREEFVIDTAISYSILSSYGAHNELAGMLLWLLKMRHYGIPLSVWTYNTVASSCPTVMEMLRDRNDIPLSVQELIARLQGHEALVVTELLGSSTVLQKLMTWEASEAKLDLHTLHLGSSYLIVLLWLEEMRKRLTESEVYLIPAEVVVVSGSGKHSKIRGLSSIKMFFKDMMVQMGSPLRVPRNNNGCFVARGKAVRDWLCT